MCFETKSNMIYSAYEQDFIWQMDRRLRKTRLIVLLAETTVNAKALTRQKLKNYGAYNLCPQLRCVAIKSSPKRPVRIWELE